MKEFKIKESNKELILFFFFDKTSTLISALLSIVLISILFYSIEFSILLDKCIYVIILFIILIYLTFNKYYEWNKNKCHKLLLSDDNLCINKKYFLRISELHSINISYNVNQFESGWTVYLKTFLGTKDYIIKKQLKKESAYFIAEKIGAFLNKKIIIDN